MLGTLISLINPAMAILGSFSGNAQVAKASSAIQDAASVVAALTPLVQSFAAGREVTEEDVRTALAGKDAALSDFDSLIKAKGG